jgi:S-adenosylmethionine/arginine decarboxylase-like enzyme
MTKYQGLHLMKFGESPKVAGYSFFQLIMESNISGHLCSEDCMMEGVDAEGKSYTYNNKGAGYIDIFSCKPYEAEVAVNCVKKHFKPESFVIKETDRI